jgi:hypothetical protein
VEVVPAGSDIQVLALGPVDEAVLAGDAPGPPARPVPGEFLGFPGATVEDATGINCFEQAGISMS